MPFGWLGPLLGGAIGGIGSAISSNNMASASEADGRANRAHNAAQFDANMAFQREQYEFQKNRLPHMVEQAKAAGLSPRAVLGGSAGSMPTLGGASGSSVSSNRVARDPVGKAMQTMGQALMRLDLGSKKLDNQAKKKQLQLLDAQIAEANSRLAKDQNQNRDGGGINAGTGLLLDVGHAGSVGEEGGAGLDYVMGPDGAIYPIPSERVTEVAEDSNALKGAIAAFIAKGRKGLPYPKNFNKHLKPGNVWYRDGMRWIQRRESVVLRERGERLRREYLKKQRPKFKPGKFHPSSMWPKRKGSPVR
jgi:hypothetical protein